MIHLAFRDEAEAVSAVEAWSGVASATDSNGRYLDAPRSLFDFDGNDFEEDEPTWSGFRSLVSVSPNRKQPGWDRGVEADDARAVFAKARDLGISCILIRELTETVDRFDAPAAAE